jgi:hypothetical protein
MDERIVYTTYDEMLAEFLRVHLERHGVPCRLRPMRVGGYYGITIGPLAEIHLVTRAPYAEKGKRLIREAGAHGFLRHANDQGAGSG